jgi:hypothetical protein
MVVSPFIDSGGTGILHSPLLSALSRGVAVRVFVHDVLNLGTPTSRALEQLRREAERSQMDLSVYSAWSVGFCRVSSMHLRWGAVSARPRFFFFARVGLSGFVGVWVIDFEHANILQHFGKAIRARVETRPQNNQLSNALANGGFEARIDEVCARNQESRDRDFYIERLIQ